MVIQKEEQDKEAKLLCTKCSRRNAINIKLVIVANLRESLKVLSYAVLALLTSRKPVFLKVTGDSFILSIVDDTIDL